MGYFYALVNKCLLMASICLFPHQAAGFNGIQQADNISDQGVTWSQGVKQYEQASGKAYKSEEGSVLAGYFYLLETFKNKDNKEALTKHSALVESPEADSYKKLWTQFNQGNHRLFPLSKLSALHVIDHLQSTAPYYQQARNLLEDWERSVTLSGAEDNVQTASHRIMAGAFGLDKKATRNEQEGVIVLLLQLAESTAKHDNIEKVLSNYSGHFYGSSSNVSPQESEEHTLVCRTILATVYYLLKNQITQYNDRVATHILKLIGKNTRISSSMLHNIVFNNSLINEFLNKKLGKKITPPDEKSATCPLVGSGEKLSSKQKPQSGYDYEFDAEHKKLYKLYLKEPDTFEKAINTDIRQYTDNKIPIETNHYPNLTQQQLVQNTVNFLLATQLSGAADRIKINAKPYNNLTGYEHFLIKEDKPDSVYKEYLFSVDLEETKQALKDARSLHSLVWIDGLINNADIKHYNYNLEKLQEQARKIWKNLYELLVNGYVFAKANNKINSFFNNAFPRELHCTGSLPGMIQTWLKKEKELIGTTDESERANKKLKIEAEELIKVGNIFIGNAVKPFIEYWLLPKYLEWANKEGHNTASIEQMESMGYQYFLPFTGGETLSDTFAKEISTFIKSVAKERAVENFNGRFGCYRYDPSTSSSEQRYNFFPFGGNWYYYTTTDSDMAIIFDIPPEKSFYDWQNPNNTKLKDTSEIKKIVIRVEVKHQDSSQNYYLSLEDYLSKKYKEYFQ